MSTLASLRTEASPWRDYPANIGPHNAITTAGKSLSDRMSNLSEILFSEEVNLRVIDIHTDENGKSLPSRVAEKDWRLLTDYQNLGVPTCTQKPYTQAVQAESALLQQDAKLPRIRVM